MNQDKSPKIATLVHAVVASQYISALAYLPDDASKSNTVVTPFNKLLDK